MSKFSSANLGRRGAVAHGMGSIGKRKLNSPARPSKFIEGMGSKQSSMKESSEDEKHSSVKKRRGAMIQFEPKKTLLQSVPEDEKDSLDPRSMRNKYGQKRQVSH